MKAQITSSALLLATAAQASQVLYAGEGFGTYYYDVVNVNSCGANFASMNTGYVECGWYSATSLNSVNSNYLVAMNATQLGQDAAMFCGKQVIVSVNGVASSLPFFIGDGCARCGTGSDTSTTWDANGAPGLDFSYTALAELSSSACSAGHVDITWEIVDNQLYTFTPEATRVPLIEVCDGDGPGVEPCQSAVVNAEANGPNAGGLCNSWPFNFGNGWMSGNVWCQLWSEPGCTGTSSAWFNEMTSRNTDWYWETQSFTCGDYVAL